MKAILRKGMATCAAMLMGANVMAQGLEEYATIMAEYKDICYIADSFTYDKKPQIFFSQEENAIIFDSEFKEIRTLEHTNVLGIAYLNQGWSFPLYYTQTLFNNDEQYEFLSYSECDFEYEVYRNVQIVNDNGECLYEFDRDFCLFSGVGLVLMPNGYYLIVKCRDESNEKVTCVYEINKDASSVNFVRETRAAMSIAPTIADRDAQITITLNEENSNVARELVVTGVSGQLIERRDIPTGENSVQIPASMLRSGMYNFTLQQKGQVVDNSKVIVK